MSSPLDLTVETGIIEYLQSTPFRAKSIAALDGGVGNYTWRVQLAIPYQGHLSVVLKHAEAYVARYPTMPFSTDRFAFEHQALTAVHKSDRFTSNDLVRVPEELYHDDERHILIMEDGGTLPSLKEFLISNPSTPLAAEIGSALGAFLADLHVWGQGNQQLLDIFSGNRTAREMAAWRISGRLAGTAQEFDGAHSDIDISQVAKEMGQEVMDNEETFIMGDFWTGNIIIKVDPQSEQLKAIFVVDWEFARYGQGSQDVAQFAAETQLLARFRSPQAASEVLSAFLAAYQKQSPVVDVYSTARHMGAHMAVLGSRLWGEKEVCSPVVHEGFALVKAGYVQDMQSLSTGPLKELTTA